MVLSIFVAEALWVLLGLKISVYLLVSAMSWLIHLVKVWEATHLKDSVREKNKLLALAFHSGAIIATYSFIEWARNIDGFSENAKYSLIL